MDNTMYQFDGQARAKSNLALAVIIKYVNEKKPTFDQLQEIFGKQATANETRAKALADTSGRKRHFIDQPLKCKDKVAYVSNQWRSSTIEPLIEIAKGMGMKITVAKEKQVPITQRKKSVVKKSAPVAPKKRGRPSKQK